MQQKEEMETVKKTTETDMTRKEEQAERHMEDEKERETPNTTDATDVNVEYTPNTKERPDVQHEVPSHEKKEEESAVIEDEKPRGDGHNLSDDEYKNTVDEQAQPVSDLVAGTDLSTKGNGTEHGMNG